MTDIPKLVVSAEDLKRCEDISKKDWTEKEVHVWERFVEPMFKYPFSFGEIQEVSIGLIDGLEVTADANVLKNLLRDLNVEFITFI